MNARNIFFTSMLILLFTLVGCSNQAYEDAMSDGMKAVEDNQLKDAIDYFTLALKEKSNDEQATLALEQVELLRQSVEKIVDGETSGAVAVLEETTDQKHEIETITIKAKEMLNDVEAMNKKLVEVDALVNEKKYEQVLELIKGLIENDLEKVYMVAFQPQLNDLEERVKKENLFTYIEGYSSNVNEEREVCQVTDSYIVCGFILVDQYYLAYMDSVELLSDDALEIVMQDGLNVVISNITKESFDMHNRTFVSIDKEDIDNQLPDYYKLDKFLNKEMIKDVLENGIGQHKLFGDNMHTENKGEARFEGYSNEEIEYARIWLEHTPSSNPPQLTVIFEEKGAPINNLSYIKDDSPVFPEDVTILVGEYTSDGMITFSSNGDGTINVYEVPSHWHQDSDEAILEATKEVLKSVEKKRVPTGNDAQVIHVLQNMIIEE